MPEQFVLDRVVLKQYRSIGEADVRLGPLTVLVGPNGSGKSNFLDALRLVSEALMTSLDDAIRNRGGIGEVRRRSPDHPATVSIRLEFRVEGPSSVETGHYEFQLGGKEGGGYRIIREECVVGRSDDDGIHEYLIEDGELVRPSDENLPPVSDRRLYLVSMAGLPSFSSVFDGLGGLSVVSPVPEEIRKPQPADGGEALRRDGSNLAGVIHRLERTEKGSPLKARIEDYLGVVVPGTHGVTWAPLGTGWETLEFVQDVPGPEGPWRFSAQSVSDGTLRALGILTALFADSGSIASPIGIEEPESALHPAAAGVLLDALREASRRRQVIVTSHSADLLDRDDFSPDELLAVRSERGKTVIGGLDDAGVMALRERLYTPGELLRQDQLLPIGDDR